MHLPINGVEYTLHERGSGDAAVLFLHYFGGSGRSWDAVIQQLPDLHCIAPDLRGFGDTQAPRTGYSLDTYADDIAALIAQLGLRQVTLVGHSMGGKIALALAARGLDTLRSVLLVAPSPPTPEPIADAERARLLATHGDSAAAQATLDKIVAHPLPRALHEQAIADTLRTSEVAWRAWLEHGSREDISARMAQIDHDITMLVGACDPAITPQLLEREFVPYLVSAHIQQWVVPDAGHLLPLEVPQIVVQTIRTLLG